MDYIGHKEIKDQLDIATKASIKLNMPLPHMIFAGVAGCGKTTLAKYLSTKTNGNFVECSPGSIVDVNSMLKIVEKFNHSGYDSKGNRLKTGIKPTILFIDEIHNLTLVAQEILGIAMENYIVVPQENRKVGRENYVYWVPYFTLIGATTNEGQLSKPFRERFKLRFIFEPYSNEDCIAIVKEHAKRFKIGITDKAASAIADRGRGIPRYLVRYLERSRDTAIAFESDYINSEIVEETFKLIGVDKEGLTKNEVKLLKTLYPLDTPIGQDTLSVITNEHPKALKDSIEPYLIQKGFIVRTGKGRSITTKGKEYIEKEHSECGERLLQKAQIPVDYRRQ